MFWSLVLVVHAGAGALWLGSMAYSLVVVQPRLSRMLGSNAEDAYRELAHGNRWPVVGIIGLLWLTGLLLVLRFGFGPLVGAKVVLLLAATVLFWWVSWRGWPRRVFALPDELPAVQRRFRRVALAMLALVGLAYALAFL